MKRRDVLAGTSGVAVAAVAGCLGAIGMDEHEASPAGVDPDVRADKGYEQTGVEELVVREEFEQAGYSETVEVTNYLTEHEKSVDMGPLGQQQGAIFTVLATPQVSLAGKDFNPIEDMDAEELIGQIEDNYDDIDDVSHDTDEEIEILGQETTNARFEADAQFDGQDVPVYIHISEAVQTDDDHIVTIGVYPQNVHDDEHENIRALMQGVVPDAEDADAGAGDGEDGGDGGDEEDDGMDI